MYDFDLDAMVDRCLGLGTTGASSPNQVDSRPAVSTSGAPSIGATWGNTSRDLPPTKTFAQNARKLLHTAMQHHHSEGRAGSNRMSPEAIATADNHHAHGGPIEVQSSKFEISPSRQSSATLRRIGLWAERKEAKRALLVFEHLQDELRECTFQPQRDTVSESNSLALSPNTLYKDNKAWGYDEFVDRLVTARLQKEQKQKEDEAKKCGATGKNWTPEPTVPEPFEFAKYQRRPIASLKKQYDAIAPIVRESQYESMSTIEAPSIPHGLFSVRPSNVIMEHASPQRW